MNEAVATERWNARPIWAALIRLVVLLGPVAASLLFVTVASRVVPAPTSSLWVFLAWWVSISAAATGVLLVVDWLARRLLPLAALFKLSLVFPDAAPSRFETALRTHTIDELAARVREARERGHQATPAEAAQELLSLVAALDRHDKLTRGHCERVRAYSQIIAKQLRLSEADRDRLNWAALLHDVGKLGIPTEVLGKSGKPTEEEWALIRRHPEIGEELIAPLRDWLGEWSRAVGDHHERWDGKGYPRGLKGDEITLGGRIVAVADVFDVITSARSYKSAFSTAKARSELAANAGTQFDERIVRAFLTASLGRLRLIMGPLSWLAHAPALGRLPLTPAVSSVGGAVTAIAAAVSSGIVGGPPPPSAEAAVPPTPPPHAASPRPGVVPQPSSPPAPRQLRGKPVPPAPAVAPQVVFSLDEDVPVVIRLRGLRDAASVSGLRIVSPPHAGRAKPHDKQSIAYAPPRNFSGTTSFGYEACWRAPRCAVGAVALTVQPVNDMPLTTGDTAATTEDEPATIDVLANDSDIEDSPLTLVSAWGATTGDPEVSGGHVAWRPPLDFHGEAAFLYAAADDEGGTSVDHVTVFVAPVNDPPAARRDVVSTDEDVAVRVEPLANDDDPDGDRLSIDAVDPPEQGELTRAGSVLTYTPPPNFSGSLELPYTATDPSGEHSTAALDITVSPVNDPPRAEPDAAQVSAGGTVVVDVTANDADPENDALSLGETAVTGPGTASVEDGRIRFTAGVAPGTSIVGYELRDAAGASAHGTLTVTVLGVNAPPSFVAGSNVVVLEDSGNRAVADWASAITPGPPHESAQAVTFTVTPVNPGLFAAGGQPALAADGTLRFTPAPNATGATTIAVQARDDGGTANGGNDLSPVQTRTITILDANDAPTAQPDSAAVSEDTASGVTFDVLANDSDLEGDSLSVASYDDSSIDHGTLTQGAGGSFTFTPDAAFNGTQAFSYTAADGRGGTATATVTITVTPVPDDPVAGDDAYATGPATPVTSAAPGLLANDGDEDGDSLAASTTPLTAPANGTLVLNADGSFTYTPNAGFSGTDGFTYRVSDGTGRTDDADVTITVSSATSTTLLYLGTSGRSADVWRLTTTPAPAAVPVPDHDGDGDPGLTIRSSGNGDSETDGEKWQAWTTEALATPLVLNGPAVLRLWSSSEDFDPDDASHPHVYLYDCIAGGLGCLRIAQNHVHVQDWNGGASTWVYHEITVGSVSRTIAAGRELLVRMQTSRNDLWVALTDAHASALAVTTS